MLDEKIYKKYICVSTLPFLPNFNFKNTKNLRTAHIGVGGMGKSDLRHSIS